MSKEFEELSARITSLVQQAFDNGVMSERVRILGIINEEAKSQVAGWEKSDWIVALIEGRDK